MNEIAEGTRPDDLFSDGNGPVIDGGSRQTELRLDVTAREALEYLKACIEASPEGGAGKRVQRIAAGLAHHIGTGAQWRHRRMVHFIEVVEH